MGHRAEVVLVRARHARVFLDPWLGARVFDLLAGGPTQLPQSAADLSSSLELGRSLEAAVLADLGAKRLLLFGDASASYVGEEEAPHDSTPPAERTRDAIAEWTRAGFRVEWAAEPEAFSAYLAERRIVIDDTVDALEAKIESLGTELRHALPAAGPTQPEPPAEPRRDPPPPSPQPRGNRFGLALILLALLVALPVRLLALPLRARLKRRARRAALRRRRDRVQSAVDSTKRVIASPGDLKLLFERGLALLVLGWNLEAIADFDACIQALGGAPTQGPVRLAAAFHNRSIARARLGFSDLAHTDEERARALGLPRSDSPRFALPQLFWAAFVVFAGLSDEDD